jgi:hypothetical protein
MKLPYKMQREILTVPPLATGLTHNLSIRLLIHIIAAEGHFEITVLLNMRTVNLTDFCKDCIIIQFIHSSY